MRYRGKGYIRMALFLLIGIIIGEVRGSHTVQAVEYCDRQQIIEDELVLILDQLTQRLVPKPQRKPITG